ncbi:MAG TPA: alanine racemase [Candidatus Krumholzibacteria bacterium]|nr:alanine racemase [Candidatus Krumholzibacteria bacterium]
MKPSNWIELRESRVRSNLRFLRRVIGRGPKFCSVVKGNAYGHGIDVYVPMAERCGVRHFAVFSAREASEVLASSSTGSSIMIMGHLATEDVTWAIENDISFFVFDLGRLDTAIRAAKKIRRPARVHLEVETGLYRTGLTERSLQAAIRRARTHPQHVRIEGMCTHLSGAESSANYYRITEQLQTFRRRIDRLEDNDMIDVERHVACSAAVFNYPDAIYDRVRVGIAQYGYWPSEETRLFYLRTGMERAKSGRSKLARVLSWKSRIMSLTTVPPGAFVGYGLSHQTLHKTRIASVPVGYSHGLPRGQGNMGRVLVHGHPCPIVGTVSMNMMTVDVTDVPQARIGDEVVLIGEQDDGEISVGAFGERTYVLNYEVLARLSSHIPRIVVP